MRKLALEAGERIMEIYQAGDLSIRMKSDQSPVTIADEEADAIISKGLKAEFPHMPLITEEQSESHALHSDRFLIVDPLDGTREFINRRGDFTVNIAYVEHGEPVSGVVYAPAKGRMFYTLNGGSVEERGPFDSRRPGERVAIGVSRADNSALTVVASKSHLTDATRDYIARYSVSDFKSAGSSLKFCLVASGEADLYPRAGRTMEWDTAAGHAVLAGAGGRVVDMDDHAPLKYGKEGHENPHFIAFSPFVSLKRQ
ncbi:MAG: 3'(2'),5'-bisphosphate nucleotidase CysQ [Roseovarius sp.]|nr:3'(2'),5'-bisphosphate nucleotidase CysQ [Roseovarius sp.]MCY4315467.1 3'(2'),5'-bisphosphate nucleotidase CysQ [Roseovarius sp.]